jgi:hypothetical protein
MNINFSSSVLELNFNFYTLD